MSIITEAIDFTNIQSEAVPLESELGAAAAFLLVRMSAAFSCDLNKTSATATLVALADNDNCNINIRRTKNKFYLEVDRRMCELLCTKV